MHEAQNNFRSLSVYATFEYYRRPRWTLYVLRSASFYGDAVTLLQLAISGLLDLLSCVGLRGITKTKLGTFRTYNCPHCLINL